MCRSLCVDYWKDLYREGRGMALLRPGRTVAYVEETHISWRKGPRLSSGWACWALSSLCYAANHDSSWFRQPRLPPQWSKEQSSMRVGMGPSPRLECGHQNPESISSYRKKRYILEMIVLSIHCIINRSETSLYDFS